MIGTFGHIVKNTGFTGLYSGVCAIPSTGDSAKTKVAHANELDRIIAVRRNATTNHILHDALRYL